MKLPKHKAGLYIEHDEHKGVYQDASDWVDENIDCYEWETEEYKRIAIDTDSIWTLQWYPDTAVGFCAVAAPTLEDLLRYANEGE